MSQQVGGFHDGVVVEWRTEEGWGSVRSPDVDGDIWVHFSHLRADGYRELTPGQRVRFTFETPGQDGYDHRAITVDPL